MADVAAVILCSDDGRSVGAAVDSVVAQTRAVAEIVVILHGPTELHAQDRLAFLEGPWLRIVRIASQGGRGVPAHRVGIATVPYVLLLDSADALESTYLEKAVACLEADPQLDFVTTLTEGNDEFVPAGIGVTLDLTAAITRGAVPSAAVFRRRIFEAAGGLDEALPDEMYLDFWITVLERGFRGRVLDEPLLRRDNMASHYNSTVVPSSYRHVPDVVLRKHGATIERLGPPLLIAKEDFLHEQRARLLSLGRRLTGLRAELTSLDDELRPLRRRIRERGRAIVDFGDFRRLDPLSPVWGLERGRPVDRYYIERFLEAHRSDIRGRVLEIKEPVYATRFGSDAVTARDVLDIVADNPQATIVADLTRADSIPSDSFDCFILTQTLHIIYDVQAALFHSHRILAPGGVLLATLPAVSRINYEDGGLDGGDFWRFTAASLARLFGELFPPGNVEVIAGGNLKVCLAFLYGLAAEELLQGDLNRFDPRYPLVYCVRAVKAEPQSAGSAPEAGVAVRRRAWSSGAVLMYHRINDLQVDPHRLCVSPGLFKSHLRYLAHRHRILSLEEFAQALAEGDLPAGAVAITLDDGTLDAFELASPILTELGIPATFFVNTDRLEDEHEPWWDILGRVFLGGEAVPAVLAITLGGERRVFPMGEAPQRAAAYTAIHRWLMGANHGDRDEVLGRIGQWSGIALSPRRTHRVLRSDELRQLARRPGHTIGSHSVHHLRLTSQPVAERQREIREGRRQLEVLLGRPVTLFSYPYGAHDPQTVELVRAAGFQAAVTTRQDIVSATADVLALPRIEVKGVDVSVFARTLESVFCRAAAV